MSKNHVLTSLKGEDVTSIIFLPGWLAAQLASLDPTENPTELYRTLFADGPMTLGKLLTLETIIPAGDTLERWEHLTQLRDNCLKLRPIPLPVVPLGF